MGLFLIIVVVLAILILAELFKHHFTKGLVKYLIIFVILIFILLVASAYIDFGDYIGEGSTFANTGHAIADGVTDDVEKIDIKESQTLETFKEKTKEFFQKIVE